MHRPHSQAETTPASKSYIRRTTQRKPHYSTVASGGLRNERAPAMSDRKPKVAVITGASQGIGEALVQAYREREYAVIATSRSIKAFNDTGILTVEGDLGNPA